MSKSFAIGLEKDICAGGSFEMVESKRRRKARKDRAFLPYYVCFGFLDGFVSSWAGKAQTAAQRPIRKPSDLLVEVARRSTKLLW
jgi:hypothetical protein